MTIKRVSLRHFAASVAFVAVIAGVGAALVTRVAVAHETGTTSEADFHRSPDHGLPGVTLAVDGQGCHLDGKPAQKASIYLSRKSAVAGGPDFDDFENYKVNPDGTWSGTYTVPAEAPPGPYLIGQSCQASDMVWGHVDLDFTVDDPNAPPTTIPPPATTVARRVPPTTTIAAIATSSTSTPTTSTTAAAPATTIVTVQRAAATETKPSSAVPWAAIVVLLVVLALIAFGINRAGGFSRVRKRI